MLEPLDAVNFCMGEGPNRLDWLPPVQSLRIGEVLPKVLALRVPPVPTLVAASRAPLPLPVYVFARGFGVTGGLEKAEEAPRRAASLTLWTVSPVVCGIWGALRALAAELIESPSDWRG